MSVEDLRREKFLKMKEREKEIDADKKRQRGGFAQRDLVHPEYARINKGELMIFRPCSYNDPRDDNKQSWESRYFSTVWMTDDNGKKFPFVWGFGGFYNSPLYEIFKVIGKYKPDKKDKKMRIYDNADCDLLANILSNYYVDSKGKESSDFDGWRGKSCFLMQGIDRTDNWCKEKKHYKVLVKDANFDEDSGYWRTSYGFGTSIYNEMYSICSTKMLSTDELDFAIHRYKEAIEVNKQKIYYEVFAPEFDSQLFTKYKDLEIDFDSMWQKGSLTEEELEYEKYDFDSMDIYKPTPLGIFIAKKKGFLKAVDEKYETNFLEKFTELADKENEKALKEAEGVEQKETVGKGVDLPNANPVEEKVVEETLISGSDIEKHLPFYKYLTTEEKDKIVGFNVESHKLKYKEGVSIGFCQDEEDCSFEYDMSCHICPNCGILEN